MLACNRIVSPIDSNKLSNKSKTSVIKYKDSNLTFIHVFVALCDNKYQGIVKVNPSIGNGQDPRNNLYWGCGYGASTLFKRSKEWTLLATYKNIDSFVLERLVFKHINKKFILTVDGYNGKYIKECAENMMYSLNGSLADTLQIKNQTVGLFGNASLVAFCGHNLLMDDIEIAPNLRSTWDSVSRKAIIIACASKPYFSPLCKSIGAQPLVWSTGLMSAEAYTLHDALVGYTANETPEQIRQRAAASYNLYQKCGLKAAQGLLVTGY